MINLFVLGFLVFSFGREFVRDYSVRQEIAGLEAEKAALENENSEIIALMNSIQTETYIEREARIKLGLAKPGEKVVILPDSREDNQTKTNIDYAAEIPAEDLSAVANPRKWWYYFFDINKFDMIKIYGNRTSR